MGEAVGLSHLSVTSCLVFPPPISLPPHQASVYDHPVSPIFYRTEPPSLKEKVTVT